MSRAVILDRYGNCIHNLTQWDSNRLIILDDFEYDIAPVFHFCNTTSYEALVVNGKLSGRQASAEIPNQLLETSNTILVYVCLCDSNNNIIETVKYFELPVHKKAKPNDYVYVKNTDYISILGLKEQLDKSVKQADKLITEASDMLLDIDDRLKNIDYQSLINNPKTPMNTESNTESRGSYELTESCTFTFKSGDKNNGYTDYEIIAEKGSLYFCSGNIGNEWHKLLLCQSGLYYCHYFDMEYEYFSLQDLVALVKQIKGKTFDLPIYCDMEDSSISGLSKSKLTAITDSFNKVIKKAGYNAGVYASKYWFDSKLDKSLCTSYHTWVAHYTSGTDKYKGVYEIWQNSSKGNVDGVNGYVDTNYLYKNIFVSATPTPQKKSTTSTSKLTAPTFKVGNTYTLQVDLKVRTGAGTNCAQKKRSELTVDGKKNSKIGIYAALKKGTNVTVKAVKKVGSNIWIQIPSGWIAGYYGGKNYIK